MPELDVNIHDVKLGTPNLVPHQLLSGSLAARASNLGAVTHDARTCYLDAVINNADHTVKNKIKTVKRSKYEYFSRK